MRLVSLAQRGEGDHGPERGMGVLAAVFANARRIALDVAGIESGAVEWRGEEDHEPVVRPNQLLLHRGHRPRRARRLRGARDHRPGLRDRIDPAFLARGGSQRGAVVEIGAAIPVAVPRLRFQGGLERGRMLPPRGGTRLLAATLGHRREVAERRMEKPPEPDAFPAPLPADPVHAVVPVARAHQREGRAPRPRAPDRARGRSARRGSPAPRRRRAESMTPPAPSRVSARRGRGRPHPGSRASPVVSR